MSKQIYRRFVLVVALLVMAVTAAVVEVLELSGKVARIEQALSDGNEQTAFLGVQRPDLDFRLTELDAHLDAAYDDLLSRLKTLKVHTLTAQEESSRELDRFRGEVGHLRDKLDGRPADSLSMPIQLVWAASEPAHEDEDVRGTVSCPAGQFPISYNVFEGFGEPSPDATGTYRSMVQGSSLVFVVGGDAPTGLLLIRNRMTIDGFVFVELRCAPFSSLDLVETEFSPLG